MADVTVTNSTVSAFNSAKNLTANAATEASAGVSQKFVFTPTKKDGKMVLLFQSASTGTVQATYSIAAGSLWAAQAITGSVGTSTLAKAITALEFDVARVLKSDGTIEVTVSPGDTGTSALTTTHSFNLYAVELL